MERLLDALNLIKEECLNRECDNCPFCENMECRIQYEAPAEWNLKTKEELEHTSLFNKEEK